MLRRLLHLILLLFADETPENCALFLSNRGLELFMRCNKVSSNNYLREVASHLIVHACMREKGYTFIIIIIVIIIIIIIIMMMILYYFWPHISRFRTNSNPGLVSFV